MGLGLFGRDGNRFLTNDVKPSFGGISGYSVVELRRQDKVDNVQVFTGQKLAVVGIDG